MSIAGYGPVPPKKNKDGRPGTPCVGKMVHWSMLGPSFLQMEEVSQALSLSCLSPGLLDGLTSLTLKLSQRYANTWLQTLWAEGLSSLPRWHPENSSCGQKAHRTQPQERVICSGQGPSFSQPIPKLMNSLLLSSFVDGTVHTTAGPSSPAHPGGMGAGRVEHNC